MMRKVMLDTNVLLDYYLGRARARTCSRLISSLVAADVEVYVTPTSLKDLFFIVERNLKRGARDANAGQLTAQDADAARHIAWSCVNRTLDWAIIANQGHAESTLAHMLKDVHGDFEDDLVLAAAETAGVDFLVTADEALLRHATVACLLPEDALGLAQAQIRP